jgi:mono/diheme cytochrome c family protein
MFTTKFASRAITAALAVTLAACGGGDGGDTTDTTDVGMDTPPAAQTASNGETEYLNACGTCHQATGEGMAGAFPPLAGSDIVILPSPDRMIAIILKGLQGPVTVKGVEYNSVMAPWESMLTDEQIAAITTYERSSWGNTASAVTVDQVAAVRSRVADRTTAWTIAELEEAIP